MIRKSDKRFSRTFARFGKTTIGNRRINQFYAAGLIYLYLILSYLPLISERTTKCFLALHTSRICLCLYSTLHHAVNIWWFIYNVCAEFWTVLLSLYLWTIPVYSGDQSVHSCSNSCKTIYQWLGFKFWSFANFKVMYAFHYVSTHSSQTTNSEKYAQNLDCNTHPQEKWNIRFLGYQSVKKQGWFVNFSLMYFTSCR